MRFASLTDGVVVARLTMAETVEYDQEDRSYAHVIAWGWGAEGGMTEGVETLMA